MQLGSPKHKAQFLYNLTKGYQENVWLNELGILEFENLLGSLRKQRAEIDLKLDRKEFKSANEGKKLLERFDSDIESTQKAIEKKMDAKHTALKRIELINQYSEAQ